MNAIQSNTQEGLITRTANADLTGKEGLFAKLVDATGLAKAALAGAGQAARYLIEEGGNIGEDVVLRPLNCNRNVRVIANATIAGGVAVASDANGKAVAAIAGDYVLGYTEEDAVAGQQVLIRPAFAKI